MCVCVCVCVCVYSLEQNGNIPDEGVGPNNHIYRIDITVSVRTNLVGSGITV